MIFLFVSFCVIRGQILFAKDEPQESGFWEYYIEEVDLSV